MKRRVRAVAVVAVIGLTVPVMASPAGARSDGKQRFRGLIVAVSRHGRRHVAHSVVVGRGEFRGVGRVVEVPNRRGDSPSVSRDNLVFRGGLMHLVSRNRSAKFTVNSRTCVFRARIQQTSKITGGTGRFRDAFGRFAGFVHARGVAARTPGGSCSPRLAPLQDVDAFISRGHLSL
jgi:hypothetical protein